MSNNDVEAVSTMPSKQDFKGQLNNEFSLQHAEGQEKLQLVEVASVSAEKTESGQAEPFSAVFQSNSATVYDQGMYRLQQAEMGDLDVFLVPINADEESVQYEAIFT